MAALVLSSHLEIKPYILFREIGEEAVLLDMDSGFYYRLDPMGKAIWTSIEKEKSAEGITQALLKEFDVDQATCQKDVMLFLEWLHKNKLLDVMT